MKSLLRPIIVFAGIVFALVVMVMSISAQADDLTDTQWQLVSYGKDTAVVADSVVTLQFREDDRITGSGGCNLYNGTYAIADDTITVSAVTSTKRACINNGLGEQEQTYFGALESATRYEVSGRQLIIEYGDGEQLVFERLADLAGSQWRLVSLDEETPVIADTEITLNFIEENQAAGSGGCNDYGGSFETKDDAISFGEIISTEMACMENGISQQEQAYFQALQSATRYEIADDQLMIEYGEGKQQVFERVNPLAETKWQLTSIDTQLAPNSVVTLEFDEENGMGGNGGCNRYGGRYELDGDNITFSEVVSTLMACVDNAVMDQEQAYFQALQSATGYEIADDQLMIAYGDGQQLVFERQ